MRALHRGRMRSRERIVELVPDRRLGYELLAGLPLRNYRTDVDLTPEPGGTAIRWSSTFVSRVPGPGGIDRWALRRFMARAADNLVARAAELSRG